MKKNILIHVGIIVALLAAACIYMSPALGGKTLVQGDIQKYEAMAHAQKQAREYLGHTPHWAPSMFGGMPGYQITTDEQHSVFTPMKHVLSLRHVGWASHIGILFLYLLGFYVAMLAFGVSPWIALVGALGFGLGSYNLIIIEAGHVTKAYAMSMMAPIMAGMVLMLRSAIGEEENRRKQMVWGAILFTLALIMQIGFNHIQITFYTAIACIAIGVAYLVTAIVKKRVAPMLKALAILVVGAALAFGSNAKLLLVNEEYARYTMRGGNELSVTPADLYGEGNVGASQNTASGLDIDYAFNWSYGQSETFTLLVPGARGGGSMEKVSEKSAFYSNFRQNRAPLYWGDQPFTSGPVYFGAVVIMLFLLGMVVTKGPERWWVLVTSILAIMLSWGSNLMWFNGWIFDHIPFYNKFRTPSMALVLANVCVAILAGLSIKAVLARDRDRGLVNRGIYIIGGAMLLLLLGLWVMSQGWYYTGAPDRQMEAQYGKQQWDMIFQVLLKDRVALLKADTLRTLVFVLLTAGTLWLYNNEKIIKKPGVVIAILGVLIVVDLWGVDKRYLSDENFVDKRRTELRRDQWDFDIDDLAARYGDHDYRVLNLAVNTYNDSKPSAFHDQIGGYSAAKLSRYQNMIDFYLSRRISPQVLAMLNTRYVVMQNGKVERVPEAMGNAWFVEKVQAVGNADEEIMAIADLDPTTTAVVDTSKFAVEAMTYAQDSTASIRLEPQQRRDPDYLKYRTHAATDRLAVFSEIYYGPDWRAYIDGQPVSHIRANYVLRAMPIPAGDHVVEFRNEAPRAHRLDTITLIVSIVTLLAMIGGIVMAYRTRKEPEKC